MDGALDPLTRAQIRAQLAIWPGDWQGLATELRAARAAGHARASFEETLLQGVLFFGFPRIVSAFEVLAAEWPAPAPPSGGALARDAQAQAGRALFDSIYG